MTRNAEAPMLVVAGEPSGDQAAAAVLTHSRRPAFGYAGAQAATAGVEMVAAGPNGARMGVLRVVPALGALFQLRRAILAACDERRPAVALLVNFSEFNSALLKPLRERGIPTLFYGPPQVWAWRPHRITAIARNASCVAVMFPFEAALWRAAGANAEYVGHPMFARAPELAIAATAPRAGIRRCALLMGSRAGEVSAHCDLFVEVAKRVRRADPQLECVILLAAGLPAVAQRRLERAAERARIRVDRAGHLPLANRLVDVDVALCVAGTATLECALAGAAPLTVYNTNKIAMMAARYLLRSTFIGLPNILLGRAAFPERLGAHVDAGDLTTVLLALLQRREENAARTRELHELVATDLPAGLRVAELLEQMAR
jgi:lipid-A-disaccharide synthase